MIKFRISIIILLILLFSTVGVSNAQTASTRDLFQFCDVDGNNTGEIFLPTDTSPVSIELDPASIDTSGNYVYFGVDIGIFERPVPPPNAVNPDDLWNTVTVERIPTNSTAVDIVSFGPMSNFSYDQVYSLSYRILYKSILSDDTSIYVSDWYKVKDKNDTGEIYFKVKPYAQEDIFQKCDINGENPGNLFMPSDTSPVSIELDPASIDTSGSYVYFGVDIGIFERPVPPPDAVNPDDLWNTVTVERIPTNSTAVDIVSFGPMSNFNYDQVYSLSYRILYKSVLSDDTSIYTSDWYKVKDANGTSDFYFRKKFVSLQIPEFTDRVTGWNERFNTEEEIARYNWYSPDSEVVCKLVINSEIDVDSYEISMDANADTDDPSIDNDEIQIKDLRIVRVDIGGTKKDASESPPLVRSETDTIEYCINLEEEDKGKDIAIYYKYTFTKKPGQENVPLSDEGKQFLNKAQVTTEFNGSTRTVEKTNTISVRDIQIMVR